MKNENFRFYIKIRSTLGVSTNEILKELKSAIPGCSLSLSTVGRWVKHFKTGNQGLKDQPRSGRPITATNESNIGRVRDVIENNPWCSYDEIEAETSLSRGTIFNIIHDTLHMKKITSRWVPHELSDKNRKDRVQICKQNLAKFKEGSWRLYDVVTGDESWFYHRQIGSKQSNASWVAEGESPRTVVKKQINEPKTMFTIFFKTSGVVSITYLDKGKTIDAQTYINESLKSLVKALKRQRPSTGADFQKFHHDNARPHVDKRVKNYLKRNKFITIDHPPYSPDLAPCDFWLFDYIKQRLGNYTSVQSLAEAITAIVQSIPKEEYLKTFHKWLERMELCIKNDGHYFEHLIK
jgi:[histone H3]-lysine36 N-dimethyltransferase SETMAR